ncbi:MAG: carbon storage regulator [Rhodanobacter sp.]
MTVIVLGVQGNAVRVGVDAPKAVPVHRQEVYEAIHTGSTEQAQPGELPPRQAANA